MKIFNNWHRALIFLLMTEVTRAQRQGSTLCRRNLSCPFQGLIPSTSHWKWLIFKGTGAQTSRIWCFLSSLVISCAHTHTHTVLTGAMALPRSDLLHPSPVPNPSFPRLFSQITFAQPWPWWQLNGNAFLQPRVSILWIVNSDWIRISSRLWSCCEAPKHQRNSIPPSPTLPPHFPNQPWHSVEIVNKMSNQAANICS